MRVVSEENLRESNLLSIYPRYRFESDLFGSEGIPSPSEPGRPIQRYLDMEECPPLELEALDEDKMLR